MTDTYDDPERFQNVNKPMPPVNPGYGYGHPGRGQQPFQQSPPPPNWDPKKKKSKMWIVWTLLGLMVLAALCAGVVSMVAASSSDDPKPATSSKAVAAAPKSVALKTAIGPGTHVVGKDGVQAGRYVAKESAGPNCYVDVKRGNDFVYQQFGKGDWQFTAKKGDVVTLTVCPDFELKK
jgi:hypothetical protein